MANNRCFDSFNTILSASERSQEKRQQTIYGEIHKNIQDLNTANPVKNNGVKYNSNTRINTTCDISNGYVDVATNYEMKRDVKDGAKLLYPSQTATPKYQSWCGNLYSADYLKYNVQNPVSNDASFNNIVIDPSGELFYDNCGFRFENTNKPENWTRIVDLSFQSTFFANRANNTLKKC